MGCKFKYNGQTYESEAELKAVLRQELKANTAKVRDGDKQTTQPTTNTTTQQPVVDEITIEKMAKIMKEIYPEADVTAVTDQSQFAQESKNVFNQRAEIVNQNVDAELLNKINSFELYEDKETLCPGGICNFTARKSTEHLIEVGLTPYPNSYNGSQLPVEVNSPMGPFKITHFVSAVAINDGIYIYDMPQNEFISDDFFGMGSDVKVKQAYKPRLIFLSLDDIQSNYNLSIEDAGNFIHSILNNRGWEGANAAPSFKEYINKNVNNSEIYIKSLEDEIAKSGYKMPEYFNREEYEKEVQNKRSDIINETLSKEEKDKVLNYYANKLRIKTREYLPTKTNSFSLSELVKSVIGNVAVDINKLSFQNALASLKEFLNSKEFIDRLLHAYEFSGTNLKNTESSISDVYSTGRLMAGFINQVKSYGIVEALTKYGPEEQYKIKGLLSTDILTKYKSKEQAALMLQKYWSNKDNIVKRLNLGKSFDNLMTSKFRYAATHNKLKTVLNYLKFSDFDSSVIYTAIEHEARRRYAYFEKNNEVQFQKNNEGNIVGQAQFDPNAGFMAGKVLIDYINGTVDTVPHEYAHLYIAWFRNTPLVQAGIKAYEGSEEALVQAIGEQAVVQRGKAWTWWKKFLAWLLNSANELSDLSKTELRNILTDAFLSRQDITATVGKDVYKKDRTSGEWVGVDPDNTIVYPSDAAFKAALDAEQAIKVKNDATMEFYPDDFDKMKAAGLIQFKNMYGDAKTYRYNKTSDAWYDVAPDNRSSTRTDIDAIEYEWFSAAEAADNYSWKNNTMLQLQNKQLNTHKSIALNRVNRYNLLATINTSITNDITSTLGISAKQKNSGAVIDPKTNIIAAITMVGSKQGVGNMANAISGRSVLMPINAHTEPSFYYSIGDENIKSKKLPIYLAPFGITEESFINDEGEEDSAYSFGSLIDSQIRSVMFHLSEYLTLQVDAVKDPVAVALGYIKANLNLVSYLSSLGVTPEKIAQFLAEPGSSGTQVNRNNIITVWHDATESNENSFHKGKFFKTYKPSDYEGRPGFTTTTFIEKSNYKLKLEFVDDELKKNSTYKGVDVKEAYINQIVDGDRKLAYHLNYAAIIRDNVNLLEHSALKILYYWDLIEQAKQYAKSVKIINADGHHSKSMNNAVEHQNNVKEQIENPIASVIRTSDLKKIISGDQSIVSGFFNAQKKYEEYFKKYFFSYERNIAPQLNAALKERYNKSSEDDLTRLMSDAHNDFLVYLFFRMQNIDPSLSDILAKDDDGNILTPKELMYSDNDNPSEVSKLYAALTAISKPKNNRRQVADSKYSGITRSTAVMLLKLLDTQLNITDARLLKDGRGVDTQSTLVDLVKLGEKISSAPTVNKYIEMFEELRNHSPEVFKIFTSLSLFQSGISNSPYNLFKGMPNTTKTKGGIIDILAKTVIAYDKFIDNSVTAGVIEAPQGWTPKQVATTTLINDFLRWYDVQYGSYLLESDRKAYHTTSKAYRKFDSSTLKYEVRVKKGEKPDKGDLTVSMGRSKYVREFFKNVDNTYTVSEVQDIEEDAVTALGVLERYAKSLIEAGVEVNKLCQ